MVVMFFDKEDWKFEDLFKILKIPWFLNISIQPLSIDFRAVCEDFKGRKISPWEVVGWRNHMDLIKWWDFIFVKEKAFKFEVIE